MKIFSKIVFFISCLLLQSCATEIVDMTGDIVGVVKDYNIGEFLANCQVTLSPTGKSTTTSQAGAFEFTDLEPGEYILTFSKVGYEEASTKVTLLAGQTIETSILLKQIVDMTGDIVGVVKDYSLGHALSNCQVTLSPTGKSTTTSQAGAYEFKDLDPGDYIVSFSKVGYEEASAKVTLAAGKTMEASILLKAKAPVTISDSMLNFGDLTENIAFYLTNTTDSECSFQVSNIPSWLSVTPSNGVLSPSSTGSVILQLNRDAVECGSYVHVLNINYTGRTSGVLTLEIRFDKIQLTVPSVSCSTSPENVSETSFTIGGKVEATGGSAITDYGHCWSVNQYPTVEDDCSKFGSSTSALSYNTVVKDLMANTTYYVRAYAVNAQGIAYSDQVLVTTKDVYSDKWDGSVATSFGGGSGVSGDPYLIKTGAQLMHMKDYPSYEYKLANDIDLCNHNWKPFPFYGKLDGDGHVIYNLRIERDEQYLGLFSYMSTTASADSRGQIKNLTLKGVYINSTSSYVGAIVGKINVSEGELIRNCKVILTEDSMIKGSSAVGGIVGGCSHFMNTSNDMISYCTVESLTDKPVLIGNSSVGGIAGFGSCRSCTAKVSISGGTMLGGICGEQVWNIVDCSYEGSISGTSYIGGLVGYTETMQYTCKIESSKAAVALYATEENVGGIYGGQKYDTYRPACIYGCYAEGTISGEYPGVKCVGGIAGNDGNIYHSYSTVTSDLTNFDGIGHNISASESCTTQKSSYSKNSTKAKCSDIAAYMKDCYSEYAHYWNYNNVWECRTVVDGEAKTIPCPRLSWEK